MVAFNKGYVKRTTRRVNILRGFDGADPTSFTEVAPVNADVADPIVSGNVVSLNDDGEWVLGAAAGKIPFLALSDQVDTDVSAAGLVPAVSLAGKFEIEVTLFADDTYNINDVLVAGTSGDLGLLDKGALDGTADILGAVTKAPADLNNNSGPTYTNGQFVSGGGPRVEAMTDDSTILTFVSNWQPLNAA